MFAPVFYDASDIVARIPRQMRFEFLAYLPLSVSGQLD